MWARSLGQEDPLEKEMATHFSILDWRIPQTKEPGRLQSMGPQTVRHILGTKQQQTVLWTPPFLIPQDYPSRTSILLYTQASSLAPATALHRLHSARNMSRSPEVLRKFSPGFTASSIYFL